MKDGFVPMLSRTVCVCAVTISVTKDGVKFTTNGDIGSANITVRHTSGVDVKVRALPVVNLLVFGVQVDMPCQTRHAKSRMRVRVTENPGHRSARNLGLHTMNACLMFIITSHLRCDKSDVSSKSSLIVCDHTDVRLVVHLFLKPRRLIV